MRIPFDDCNTDEPPSSRLTARMVGTVVIANALEFFDYFAYATFAAFITQAFFTQEPHARGALLAFGIFAAGFLSRPIGALLIGAYADTAGRKPALLLTSALITIGTLGVAVVPTHATLGSYAPFLVLCCRVLQGVAIGGEMGSASALLVESCAPARKALYAGCLMAGQGLALVVAGSLGIVMYGFLQAGQIAQWGWRLPFALAAALIPVQIALRRRIQETWQPGRQRTPLRESVTLYRREWLIAIVLIFGGTVPTYVATYVSSFGLAGVRPTIHASFVTTLAVGAVTLVLSVAGGWLADRVGHLSMVVISRGLTMAAVLPAFHFAALHHDALTLACVVALFAGLSALGGGPSIVVILNMFPVRGRAVAMSLVYAIGVALFGGTAPFVVASVDLFTGGHLAAAWYIFFSSAVTVLTVCVMRERCVAANR
ncbi:MFS transporter [Paraburkholderia terricola]|uniref:MFS family permease n=1 Tax=Paraburkholderia terricola TaxID=169427 RepID=A0ABU1LIV9_9BURK|nr:MFS transporter [Paraburkholderia terricola]MDR6406663.1 MFS family permease [Paraburkholderia terricola]MDR6479657.1 MFS family permease [Paraburkholderia terricola]